MSALIRLIFSLPFMVWRMLRPIRRLGWRVVWHSVYYFLRRPVRLVYLAGVIVLGMGTLMTLSNSGTGEIPVDAPPPPPLPGTSAVPPKMTISERLASEQVQSIPPMQGAVRDGNSRFGKTLIERLKVSDLQRYSAHYMYAMDHVLAGTPYRWQVRDDFYGEIIPQAPFKAPAGIYCRSFQERSSYQGRHERFKGIACQRQQGGWCKLRPASAKTCGIDPPSGWRVFWENIW